MEKTKDTYREEETTRHHKQINASHVQQLLQNRNKTNVFLDNSDSAFQRTSARELNEERFSRMFESKDDVSTLPSDKYATLVNYESTLITYTIHLRRTAQH